MSEQPARPSGTVTFLFTDIEGSTRHWEASSAAMQVAHTQHEAILRRAIEAHGGYAYKMIGDAFQAAFQTAPLALQATIQAQRELHAASWPEETGEIKVRMALHTGLTDEREGDYVGPLLNRAARLMSAGYGGQVLVTLATSELARDTLPAGAVLRDMGEHRLKDLTRAEHVYQLVCDGLPVDFPPLKTLDNRPNNLPVQPTPFIGRDKELGDIGTLLKGAEARLVTLTGPGGTGKTRLSLQAGAEALDDFHDGVWFVELAALEAAEHRLVISTISQALGVTEAAGKPLISTLIEHLKEKRLLLVLDNFEQVIDAAPQVGKLIAGSPALKVLVSSRIKLNVYGERDYAVPPLALPDIRRGHLPPLDRLLQYEALRLFISRAQAAKADFQMTKENAQTVAEICVRLDGLPLAIELAAARVKMLPPQALLTRLSSRLKLLTGGARDLSTRQQTLRGAIDWSYSLLSPEEQHLFRRLAIFQGGRTLQAMEEVCNSDGALEIDVLDGVQSLLDKSLIQQREGRDGEPHFVMLETIHEYACEKLGESGEAEALGREHAFYFMRLAEEAEAHLTGEKQQEWLDKLEEEYDNSRAALAWSRSQAKEEAGKQGEDPLAAASLGLRSAGALWRFWYMKGLYTEGRELLEGAIATSSAAASAPAAGTGTGPGQETAAGKKGRAKALNAAGILAQRQGDNGAARTLAEAALAIGREICDKQSMALSLNNLGNIAQDNNSYADARTLYEECLTLRRELGDKHGISISLNNLGVVAYEQEDDTSARALWEESLALGRQLEDKWGISIALNNLGSVLMAQGDHPRARAHYEESLSLLKELGDKFGTATSLNCLGNVASSQREYTRAGALFSEGLDLFIELEDKKGIAQCLSGFGGISVGTGRAERGVRLLGAAKGLLASIGTVLYREDRLPFERSVQHARTLLSEEDFNKAQEEGQGMSMEAAIEYARGGAG